MNFLPRNSHTNMAFNNLGIVKFIDYLKIENCLFVNKCLNDNLPNIFKDWFTLVKENS